MVLTRKAAEKGRLRPKASVSMYTAWCLLEREGRSQFYTANLTGWHTVLTEASIRVMHMVIGA